MKIELFNKCSKNILLRINDYDCFLMKPFEKKTVLLDCTGEIELSVRKEESSFLEKNIFHKKYILAIETKYIFRKIENEVIALTIIRETVRVTGDAYYDKLILCEKSRTVCEHNSVCDVERVRDIYNKRYFLNNVLISPFEHFTFLILCVLVLSVVFSVKISLFFSVMFFVATYIFIWALDNMVRKLSHFFHKKLFDVEDDKCEFEKILTEKHINAFYQMDVLQAYNNEIIRDEL